MKNAPPPTARPDERRGEDVEYYNDLPGKRPPANLSAPAGAVNGQTQQLPLYKVDEKHKKGEVR